MPATTTTTPAKQAKLDQHAAAIRRANERLASQFRKWLEIVAGELKAAQAALAKNGSHDSEFGKWVVANTEFSRAKAYRLIDAGERMAILSPIGDSSLPANESQCRQLASVPTNVLTEVWNGILEKAEADGLAVTAGLIRKETADYRTPAVDTETKCRAVAEAMFEEAGVKTVKYHNKGLCGGMCDRDRISVPHPTTQRRLYICAHEAGHVAKGHTRTDYPSPRQEFEAECWAHEAMRHHGITVPVEATWRAKEYVAMVIDNAIRRGANDIDNEALKWCEDYHRDRTVEWLKSVTDRDQEDATKQAKRTLRFDYQKACSDLDRDIGEKFQVWPAKYRERCELGLAQMMAVLEGEPNHQNK